MNKFDLKYESEVVLSKPLHQHPLLKADKG